MSTIPQLKPAKLPPQAEWREATLPQGSFGYLLKRSKRKSIGLRISDEGLVITAPHWATDQHLQEALNSKSNWIILKLQERVDRLAQQAMSKTIWQNEGLLPYLGTSIRIQLIPHIKHTVFSGDIHSPTPNDRLCLALTSSADSQRIQDSCHVWLQQQAQRDFQTRINRFLYSCDYAHRFRQLRLSSPSKRWGSCSSHGTIMLNWRLIHFKPAIIDYVVAHEVAHLKEMNHSPAFWQEVERLLPDFYTARQQLKQFSPNTLPLF